MLVPLYLSLLTFKYMAQHIQDIYIFNVLVNNDYYAYNILVAFEKLHLLLFLMIVSCMWHGHLCSHFYMDFGTRTCCQSDILRN